MDTELPLDEDELDELDDFLRSEAVGEDAMDVSMLDGFLTALAVGPTNLPPALWLPMIWGKGANWPSEKVAERMRMLVLRHANGILLQLREEPDAFDPLLWEREVDGRTVSEIGEWCSSFVQGMALDIENWQPLLDSDDADDYLYPILLHGTEDGARQLENDPTLDDDLDEHAAMLGECAAALMEHWLPQRKRASTLRREAPKVGRNAPCPCGSGQKFKKCCGLEPTLH